MTYPDNKQVTYTYDVMNRIQSAAYPDFGATPVAYTYTLGSNDNTVAVQYPNGINQMTKRDALLELQSHTIKMSGVATWAESYTYDGFGNISATDRTKGGAGYHYR